MKLNLGCGTDIKNGFVNVDNVKLSGVDVVHDLNKRLPFKDKSFNEIICLDVIEHISDTEKFMKEICRVAKPNSKITITTPHFSSVTAFTDPQHIRYFSAQTIEFFIKGHNRSYYSSVEFNHLEYVHLSFDKHWYVPHLYLLELLLDNNIRAIRFYERYLCFIFPSDNIKWIIRS